MQAYPEGLDCVWLAVDRNRDVGAFITAGVGPIPTPALGNYGLLLPDIEDALHGLPEVTTTELLVTVKRPDSFVELAERGLYVFDWSDVERSSAKQTGLYEPVAIPTNPIRADALPASLLRTAMQVQLDAVLFADQRGVRVSDHATCALPAAE